MPAALFPEPHRWIAARQYTGRVVSVVNAEVFRQPVFNYTASFELLWVELRIPVRYGTDLAVAERIVLDAAREHTREHVAAGREQLESLRRYYRIEPSDLEPQAFVRLTDDWLELSVRFLVSTHGIRIVKDRISRDVIAGFASAHIEIASKTIEIVRPAAVPSTPEGARAATRGE